jgi:hypothetical protein
VSGTALYGKTYLLTAAVLCIASRISARRYLLQLQRMVHRHSRGSGQFALRRDIRWQGAEV